MFIIGKESKGHYCATVNFEGHAWFSTGMDPPTRFETEEEAQRIIEASKAKWPDTEFKIFDEQDWGVHPYTFEILERKTK